MYSAYLTVSSNAPFVSGATANFVAVLHDYGGLYSGPFEFEWRDNGMPPHTRDVSVVEDTGLQFYLNFCFRLKLTIQTMHGM